MKVKFITTLLFLIFVFSFHAFSQRRAAWVPFSRETQFSLGFDLAAVFPQGFGIGGSFRYEQPLKVVEHLTVLASIGFIAYSTSQTYDYGTGAYKTTNNALFIPVMGGAKYYFPGPTYAGFYGSLEAGFGFGSSSYTYAGYTGGPRSSPDYASGVMICPGAGYLMAPFDFSIRYFSVGIVGLRAAYIFRR